MNAEYGKKHRGRRSPTLDPALIHHSAFSISAKEHFMSARRDIRRSGRTMAVGVGVIGVVGIATLLAVLFKGGGTGTGGTGTGTGTSATMPAQNMVPSQPQRPLKVTIRENDYVVNGRPVDLVTLTE